MTRPFLHRPVGGEKVMVRQLERLGEISGLPTVSIRVMPFGAGLHHGALLGQFAILWFPLNGNGQETEPPTVHVDGVTGELYLDKPHEVDRLRRGVPGSPSWPPGGRPPARCRDSYTDPHKSRSRHATDGTPFTRARYST